MDGAHHVSPANAGNAVRLATIVGTPMPMNGAAKLTARTNGLKKLGVPRATRSPQAIRAKNKRIIQFKAASDKRFR
ncbi:hypothetical protein [Bosea sp. 685]|uniref:hypothetical protein n=1 Tax=Bosea sp. 685 TaxID=3080057 RepID=UPI0028931DCA|nr:hypothetical protein [Bosea sp. 685]WNJ90028.1 hypothetical protein RMR04_27160 [Bosea sp. 685]